MESGIQVTFEIRTGIQYLESGIQGIEFRMHHLHQASSQETIYIECILEDQDRI